MKLNTVLFSWLQNSWFYYLYHDIVNELTRYDYMKEIKSIVKVVATNADLFLFELWGLLEGRKIND